MTDTLQAPNEQVDVQGTQDTVQPAQDSSYAGQSVQPNVQPPQQPTQNVQQPNQNQPKQPNQPSAQPQSDSSHHSIFRSLFETLAGPKFEYHIGPDGKQEAVRINSTKSQLANSIVAGALTGMFAGASTRPGPGQLVRAFGAGGEAGVQRNEKIDQQAQQTAQQDFARKAGVAEANMRALIQAHQLSRMDAEDIDSAATSMAPVIESAKDLNPDFVGKEHVSEDEAKDLKKWNPTEWTRAIDGKEAQLDSNGKIVGWNHTYTMLRKDAQVPLVDADGKKADWLQQALDNNLPTVPQALYGKDISPNTPPISAYTAAKLSMENNGISSIQKELDKFHETNKWDTVNVKDAIKNDPSMAEAIFQFQRASGGVNPNRPDLQLQKMLNDPKAAKYAPQIEKLFGGNMEQFKKDMANKDAADKETAIDQAKRNDKLKNPETPVDAQATIAADKASPGSVPAEAVSRANHILKGDLNYDYNKQLNAASARQRVEQAAEDRQQTYLQVPDNYKYDPTIRNVSATEAEARLKSQGVKIPNNFGDLWKVGRNEVSLNHGLPTRVSAKAGQMDTQTGISFINKFINPDYREYDYPAAQDFAKELGSTKTGTAGGAVFNAGVAANHLKLWDQAMSDLQNGKSPDWNRVANAAGYHFGKGERVTADTILEKVISETEKVASGSAPREAELAEARSTLHSSLANGQWQQASTALKELMAGRISEVNEKSQQYLNRPAPISRAVTETFKQAGIPTPWEQTVEQSQQQATGAHPNTVQTAPITVQTPQGAFQFKDQQSADAFKKNAGIQ